MHTKTCFNSCYVSLGQKTIPLQAAAPTWLLYGTVFVTACRIQYPRCSIMRTRGGDEGAVDALLDSLSSEAHFPPATLASGPLIYSIWFSDSSFPCWSGEESPSTAICRVQFSCLYSVQSLFTCEQLRGGGCSLMLELTWPECLCAGPGEVTAANLLWLSLSCLEIPTKGPWVMRLHSSWRMSLPNTSYYITKQGMFWAQPPPSASRGRLRQSSESRWGHKLGGIWRRAEIYVTRVNMTQPTRRPWRQGQRRSTARLSGSSLLVLPPTHQHRDLLWTISG